MINLVLTLNQLNKSTTNKTRFKQLITKKRQLFIYLQRNKIMYYKQLPCIYHPNLNITNFCQDQDCLMPLCPSCIREHTQYHEEIKTKPSYFNIYEAIAETDTLITNNICNLQKDKKRNSEMIFKINRLPAIVRQKILQAKTIALKIVEQSFSQLQRDTLQAIEKINQQMSMHSIRKSQQLQESLVSNLQDLYDLTEGLKRQSCLSDMIFFLKEKRFQVQDLHGQMSQYLYTNQNYDPYIEINKQAQQSLAVLVHRMFKLDQKEKINATQRTSDRQEGKGLLYENSYHISLTPSKIKKPLYSLGREKASNPNIKYTQNSLNNNTMAMNSRQRNTSYQNHNEYQEHIQRSKQTSRDKNLRPGEDGSFRQISIRDKERKLYYPLEDDTPKRTPQDTIRRRLTTTEVRYPGFGKF